MEIVQCDRVQFAYDEEEPLVLRDVSFTVQRGSWVSIVGHNGSGKSTLANLMIGLYVPQRGEMRLFGEPYTIENVWALRAKIGVVFQNPDNQFVGTTVQDDVAFALENQGVPHSEMVQRVESALRQVGMFDYADAEPHHLSGGQKQRVAIASAIALRPQLLILDEATSMLDPQGRIEVIETVQQLKRETDVTVISITHDLEEVLVADDVIVMNEGKRWMQGPPATLFERGEQLEEIGLDLPFVLKVAAHLRKEGVDVRNERTEEKLVTQLWTSYFNK